MNNVTPLVRRGLSFALAGAMFAACMPLAMADSYSSNTTTSSYSTKSAYTIPAGTALTIRPVSNNTLAVGETYVAEVVNPVTQNGQTVIPAGAQVRGEVTAVHTNSTDIRFNQLAMEDGTNIQIESKSSVNRQYGSATENSASTTTTTSSDSNYSSRADRYLPDFGYGRSHAKTRWGRLAVSTVGGAATGAVTGALLGVILPAVYSSDIGFSEGTGAVRGVAWGAAVGAGLGLATGLVAAALPVKDDNVAVTTTTTPVASRPMTNITTGSLEEIPVTNSYSSTSSSNTMSSDLPYTIVLKRAITINK